jgi:hypothetical protein
MITVPERRPVPKSRPVIVIEQRPPVAKPKPVPLFLAIGRDSITR